MKNVEVYIDPNSSPVTKRVDLRYERLELFEEDSIQITSSIQNIKDIGSIFTDFSQTFSVPAQSKKNNLIFSRWYNLLIETSFDPRIKKAAIIKIDGSDWRYGWIRLTSAKIKDGVAESYELVFLGNTVAFKDILGDDKLEGLDLNIYNHGYNEGVVKNGLQSGLKMTSSSAETPDIVYPLISYDKFFYYDSSGAASSDEETNVYVSGSDTAQGINYTELKPALKIRNIFDAIENRYSSTNDDNTGGDLEFQFPTSSTLFNKYLDEAYLILHRDKGNIGGGEEGSTLVLERDDFDGSPNFNANYPYTLVSYNDGRELEYWVVQYNVIPQNSSASYNLVIKDYENANSTIVKSNVYGQNTITLNCITDVVGEESFRPYLSISSEDESQQTFSISVNVFKYRVFSEGLDGVGEGQSQLESQYSDTVTGKSLVSEIIVTQQIPDMKVFDFLESTFKMFNLTAFIEVNGLTSTLVVQPLDDYYSNPSVKTYDITEYVDDDSYTIAAPKPYNEINFKYADPKTFGIIQQNNVYGTEFGDLTYQANVFSGGKLDIKSKFERMLFTRINDKNGGGLTNVQTGWVVSDDENPIKTNPMVVFNINEQLSGDKIGIQGLSGSLTKYNRPSNVSSETNGEVLTLNFNAEPDEFSTDGDVNENSLYRLFWEEYITSIYAYSTKYFKGSSYLPQNILQKNKLNDIFLIDGVKFRINEITTNLLTGKSDLELVTLFDSNIVNVEIPDDFDPPDFPIGADITLLDSQNTNLNIEWTEATDSRSAVKYNVYVDGVSAVSGISVNTYNIQGLQPSVSYTIVVRALDDSLNFTEISKVLTTVDVSPPVMIGSLSFSETTNLSTKVSWRQASDNVGVSYYTIYRSREEGAFIQIKDNVTDLYYNDYMLDEYVRYDYRVTATDVNGLVSSPAIGGVTTKDLTAPILGGEITDSDITYASIRLDWDNATDNGSGVRNYLLEYRESGDYLGKVRSLNAEYEYNVCADDVSSDTPYTSVSLNDSTINLSGLESYTDYEFRVSAFDNAGNQSDYISAANVRTLSYIRDISATLSTTSNFLMELGKIINYKDVSASLTTSLNATLDLESYVVYKDVSGSLSTSSTFSLDLDVISPIVWLSFSVNNIPRSTKTESCFASGVNDTWYTEGGGLGVGTVVYSQENKNFPIQGNNNWYMTTDGFIKVSMRINNSGVVREYIPC
jgi:hypothetical protein